VDGWHRRNAVFLGLGLPSAIRLPTVRSGSTASLVLVGGANAVGPSFGAPTSAATFSVSGNNNSAINDDRLSVDSALNNPTTTPAPPLSSQAPPQQALLSVLYASSEGGPGSGEERW